MRVKKISPYINNDFFLGDGIMGDNNFLYSILQCQEKVIKILNLYKNSLFYPFTSFRNPLYNMLKIKHLYS